uniref:HEAT repeat-containing protein 6 n=1 Tax=Takifugu rubripes TaxID=31033 RepID=A0A674NSF0_TAKRU
MAAHGDSLAPVYGNRDDATVSSQVTLSADTAPFFPARYSCAFPASDTEKQFFRCTERLRYLRPDSERLREELNLLFDQLLSESYNLSNEPSKNIQPEVNRLVPHSQEHMVIKLCQLIHHLLNQLKVILDEQTLDILVNYTTTALKVCSTWTHSDILLALSAVVYYKGPQCQRLLSDLLKEDGILLLYGSPSQPNDELRHVALTCMASICLRMPGQPPLDDHHRYAAFGLFLRTLQSPKPPNTDELFCCTVIQAALKGLQNCFSVGKWKFRGAEELGSTLASLKRLMFHGTPGVGVEWPAVLYPSPLPQYEGQTTPKSAEPPSDSSKDSANKKKKARGKAKNPSAETSREDGEEDEREAGSVSQKVEPKLSAPSLYPSWKTISSDSEISDPEGSAQSKLRVYQGRVRQGALQCLLAVVKSTEKRVLYGYWSSFIPDSPAGGLPPLSLITVILKDPSPRVRACALQVLSAMLDGSHQFLAVAEDTAAPRTSYTPFSFLLATAVRELHRALSLALLAETSHQTLTQVIKCLAYLVANAPYHRLRPGLLSPLWKQMRPYLRHRDVNVRVTVLTLYGALVTTQAPLPEVQLLLQQPEGSTWAGSSTPGGSDWRQRDNLSSPAHKPVTSSQRGSCTHSPGVPQTPAEDGSLPWLMQLCASLITQPREDHSDSEGATQTGSLILEPLPVRLEALQVMCHLVRGYFSLVQANLCEIGQVSICCLKEAEPSIQLHGAKLIQELGTGIIKQYKAENNVPESIRVPLSQVVQFWSDILSGPLNGALQNNQQSRVQMSACDVLSSILPQAFEQLPYKTQMMCITVLLGVTYSENYLKTAAVRALGIYIMFPCLREDVMFVTDTANALLAALEDRCANVRLKAAWSLGNLTDTLRVNIVGVEFQEELSDTLLLKMLQAATRASSDKDRVRSNAVRVLGNLLHFLRQSQLSHPTFQRPVEDAVRALVKTVQSDSVMKVRWNACYALGNAFRNPALSLGSAPWSSHAFSSLCLVVTSCKNFKVRIKSAAALAVPAERICYGDSERFISVWRSLATALQNSDDVNDFLEYRFSASLRHTLSQALLHLLSLSQAQELPALGVSLAGEEGESIMEQGEEDMGKESFTPQQRVGRLQQTLMRLKDLKTEGEGQSEQERGKAVVVQFLEDLLKACEEMGTLNVKNKSLLSTICQPILPR